MSISIDQWCASIGLFYGQVYGHFSIKLGRGCCVSKWLVLDHAFLHFLLFYFSSNMGLLILILDLRKKKQDFFLTFIGM